MKWSVTVRAGAKMNRVLRVDETHFRISVKACAKEGEANEAVLKLLAKHFDLPRARFSILHGLGNKNKVIEFSPGRPSAGPH